MAKAHGFQIILVYIYLQSPELNQARVAQRVSEGGHSVPNEKIRSRISRTMANIRKVLPLVDIAQFYDNSERQRPFQSAAKLHNGQLIWIAKPQFGWIKEILNDYL